MRQLTTEQVWNEIEQNLFAVLGMVTPKGEARTVGIVYVVADHKFYIGSQKAAWKVKHIARNPGVSLTIPIAKRIPLMPWIKIPAATITLSGTANVWENSEVRPAILKKLYRDVVKDEAALAASCVIEVLPQGEFVTYGVGIPLMQMRFPEKARGRVAVSST
ncbi:MAG TPA: pyridoxamine 5'-phosphate oxidase family protein [Caldilineaceae bacterium]|nr:pyridoxamine 5'-phosphate oxidase family protein [Caldilineaceae bacterium]